MKTPLFKKALFFLPLFFLTDILCAQALSFRLKSAPPDLSVIVNGVLQKPVSTYAGIRSFRINDGNGTFSFSAQGYKTIQHSRETLPLRNGLLEIKLENEQGRLKLLAEYPTGFQPKSAYFSPDGKLLVVPLLGEHGIDVFRFEQPSLPAEKSSSRSKKKKSSSSSAKQLPSLSAVEIQPCLVFAKRLSVPESKATGFVEALFDIRRRELWVSNMEENKVHIYDIDTLEYKTSSGTGGVYPKVIVQNPRGDLTLVSNWASQNISIFDSETKKLLRRIPVGGTPRGMAFSPDGEKCYVAIYDAAVIAVIDMNTNKVSARFRFHQKTGAARHVIYSEGKLYVSDMYQGTVNILNAATGALLASKYVGYNINTIVLSPDRKWVFASSRGRNDPEDYTRPGPELGAVYMLSADDLTLQERVWGRNQPTGLAVTPDGKHLVFTDFLDKNLELYTIER